MDTLAIIKRIEARLAELGMSKADFYNRSGISSASFSQWRTGTYKPSLRKIERAAEVLGVSADYLVNGTYRSVTTSFTNGICAFSGSSMADIEKDLCTKEPGTYRIAFRSPNTVITVDNDSEATDEQINGVIAIYAKNEKTPTGSGGRSVSDEELKFALWGDCEDVSDDDLADVRRYAAFVRERKKDQK